IIDGGFSLQYSPLLEYREGKGMVLFCQMDVTGRTEEDPAATRLVRNILSYVSGISYPVRPTRKALYVGDADGKRHFQRAGISPGSYEGGELLPGQVLIVGRGGGQALAEHVPAVARWLKAGGHLLALELDAEEANTFLPAPIRTTKREHIAAYFKPPGVGSPFAGVGPADVHDRDPRAFALVSSGAKTVADGVLAQAEDAHVVFCQLAPYRFVKSPGDVPGLTVNDADAAEGKQSALLTMGTVPQGQFGQQVKAGQVGKTYTCAVSVKALGDPVTIRLEVERAAGPWDRAVRGKDIELAPDKWTDLHVTFKVDKPYPEGWSAYLHCGQPEARLRVDRFLLYEGGYVQRRGGGPTASGVGNLFANPGFETGTEPWFFRWRTEQQNLRKTFRRSSFLVTRLLANMGVRGQTPLLSRLATPVAEATGQSILENGDFSVDADDNGVPDHWTIHPKDAFVREREPANAGRWSVRVTCTEPDEKGKGGSVSLAQPDVAVRKGQWYRISFRAKAEGLRGAQITLAIQDTSVWRSLVEYQRFSPNEQWKQFTFLVKSKDTAETKTRFMIWHGNASTVWFSDLRIVPCDPPSQGRWLTGLYLDEPQEWDDPYRFFRW
ncbi:MAG: carbohydrate binding domain-containing protein, partial [Pirellulales bacterium]